jgi:hypothetical protein
MGYLRITGILQRGYGHGTNQPGTLPCVRVIWGAWALPPAVAEAAVEAERPVLALPEVVVDLARLPLLALLAVLALLEVVAELAVEEVPVEALHRSFSAAMVVDLPSTGTPRYSPVPRSGRKAKRRP